MPGPPPVSTYGRSNSPKACRTRNMTARASVGRSSGTVMCQKVYQPDDSVDLCRLVDVAGQHDQARQHDDRDERGGFPDVGDHHAGDRRRGRSEYVRMAEADGLEDGVQHAVGRLVDVAPQLGVDDRDHRPGDQQQRHHPAAAGGEPLEYQGDSRSERELHDHGDERVHDREHERVPEDRSVNHCRVVGAGDAGHDKAVAGDGDVAQAHHDGIQDREDRHARDEDERRGGEQPAQPREFLPG